jgi:NADH oxidase (H2O-forming)
MRDIIEVKNGIHWIGALHPDLRLFDELYATEHGTTYNSFLVRGSEKNAIIDTVKAKFADDYLAKVRQLIDPAKVDYIIVNHTEPDHSGSLARLLGECPNATVVCTQAAATFLGNLLHTPFKTHVVKDREVLELGEKSLRFFITPFLHWPDTMFTLAEEDRILFTCDAFGAHYCGTSMFNDEVPDLIHEMNFYFDCLVRPFKDKVLSAIEKIRNEKIEMICPSHGPLLRKDSLQAVTLYEEWCAPKDGKKIVIFYISPHGNTGKMSGAVAEGASLPGIEVLQSHIIECDENKIRDLMEEADALVFGVPTINRDIPKPMWNVLADLSTVKLKSSLAGVFGSYGWSGEACKITEDRLRGLYGERHGETCGGKPYSTIDIHHI